MDREIPLGYYLRNPHSTSFNPQRNKTPSYHSPVEVVKFLRIPQWNFTSSIRHFPYNRVYSSKRKFINILTSKHEDLHILNSSQGFLFPSLTTVKQTSSNTHTLHPYIINMDNTNALYYAFHTT